MSTGERRDPEIEGRVGWFIVGFVCGALFMGVLLEWLLVR